ncbi:MAG: TIGR01777 family protein [Actinobacteria bacterium]|nr:MAG: TIGR01777 family protein [Actinomycetota bacterium]
MTGNRIVVIAGASGFIGSALVKAFDKGGYEVRRLVRKKSSSTPRDGDYVWDPGSHLLDEQVLANASGVICMNGASLLKWPWNDEYKQVMRMSRLDSVATVVDAMKRLPKEKRPRVFLSGSAIGYYGTQTGEKEITETSPAGKGFLAKLCTDWEAAAREAEGLGVRTVLLRTGLVMGAHGGLLGAMRLPYSFGVGAQIGDGSAWMSVISLVDYVRATIFCLVHPEIKGPVNMSCPTPVQNRQWHTSLAQHLRRPALLRMPESLLRFAGGEMASEAILASQRAIPQRLIEAGFNFTAPTVGDIFAQVLPQKKHEKRPPDNPSGH